MKRKIITTLLSLTVAGTMAFAPAAAFAASDDAAQTAKTESTDEKTEDADKAEETAEDLTVKTDTQEVTVKNQTGYALTAKDLKDAKDADKDADKKEDAVGKTLTVTGKDETDHVFENVDPDSWTDPVIYDEYGFLYIKYQDADKKEQEIAETADEKEWDSPLTMYLLSNVNVREQADKESKSLKVLSTGTEVKAVAIVPEWIKIETDEVTGYIYHSYITENKEAADAKVKAEKEAKEAKEKAAAEAAQAAAASQASSYDNSSDYSYQEPSYSEPAAQPSAPYEVGRQQYDDCDGSGHGYYEITYSDGSVSYEEY